MKAIVGGKENWSRSNGF